MNNENKQSSMGKWSVAFALISLTIFFLLLLCVMIPKWFGVASSQGESGLAAAVVMGIFLFCGIIVVTITSLTGIGLAVGAIRKTSWRQGRTGLLLNIAALLITIAFLLWFFL